MAVVAMKEKITRRRAIAGIGVGATGIAGATGLSTLASSDDSVDYDYELSTDDVPTKYVARIKKIPPEKFLSVGLWVFAQYDRSLDRWPTQIGVVGGGNRGAIINEETGEEQYWAEFPPPQGHTTLRLNYAGSNHDVYLRDEQGIMEHFQFHIARSKS